MVVLIVCRYPVGGGGEDTGPGEAASRESLHCSRVLPGGSARAGAPGGCYSTLHTGEACT